jgi:DNA-binding CsgD family transcriptional regulator
VQKLDNQCLPHSLPYWTDETGGPLSVDTEFLLDQFHAAILNAELAPKVLLAIQAWMGTGQVRVVIETANLARQDICLNGDDASPSQPNVWSMTTCTAGFSATLSIDLPSSDTKINPEKMAHLKRQLVFSLGALAAIRLNDHTLDYTRGVVDMVPQALVLIDGDGHILHANSTTKAAWPIPALERMFQTRVGLQAIHKAFVSGQASTRIVVGDVDIKVQIDRVIYPVTHLPLAENEVCIAKLELPSQDLIPAISRLTQRYSLSRSEAAVLALCADGQSIQMIARMRGVSDETARTQLRALRRKIGVHSQLELSAIVRQEKRNAMTSQKADSQDFRQHYLSSETAP